MERKYTGRVESIAVEQDATTVDDQR